MSVQVVNFTPQDLRSQSSFRYAIHKKTTTGRWPTINPSFVEPVEADLTDSQLILLTLHKAVASACVVVTWPCVVVQFRVT